MPRESLLLSAPPRKISSRSAPHSRRAVSTSPTRGRLTNRAPECEHGNTRAFTALLATLVLALGGCAASIPADPEGTLAEVTGGTLRVGATDSGEWVQVEPGVDATGVEARLAERFATTIDAEVQWVQGSEHELVELLKHGELDLVIGGFADDTPWTRDAGTTRPYAETVDARGNTVKHVMLVRKGENAFLLELDRFLVEQAAERR